GTAERRLHRMKFDIGRAAAAVLMAITAASVTFLWSVTSANQDLPICHMIATGGTIAMKEDPASGAPVPALSGEDLIASVPELASVARIRVESLFNIPSDHMDPERWRAIQKSVVEALSSDEVAGVIISHGT